MYLNVCDYPMCMEDTVEFVCQSMYHMSVTYMHYVTWVVLVLWL